MEEGNVQLPGFVLRKHLEQQEIDLAQNRDYMREVIAGYDYKLIGMENLDGRETYVIGGDPRPGYQPRHKNAKLLLCFRLRIWIDKSESQWVKLDAQYTNIFPFGLFPLRLQEGSRAFLEATPVNDEIWLPKHVDVKVDARLGLIKGFYEELEVTYHDYKKFRADWKITGVREAPEQR